ncbi:MAG TPA: hypothetical protein VI455_19440 [Terriglobia bacterium]
MNRVMRIGLVLPILLVSGCATNNAIRAPDANLSKLKTFYVVRVSEDERGIEKLIAARLNVMGYQSTSGDTPKPATPVDAIVTEMPLFFLTPRLGGMMQPEVFHGKANLQPGVQA